MPLINRVSIMNKSRGINPVTARGNNTVTWANFKYKYSSPRRALLVLLALTAGMKVVTVYKVAIPVEITCHVIYLYKELTIPDEITCHRAGLKD